jgi:hypothetical protein
MDTRQIQILLEKYFEGLTSLAEEALLYSYFSGDVVAEELLPYREQFRMLQAGREPLPRDTAFEERLAGLLEEEPTHEAPLPDRRIRLFPRLAAAATVALLIGASVFMVVQQRADRNKDTFSDPQLAYIEAQKTLLYISKTMNKGMEPLKNVSKINEGTGHLKTLKKLDSGLEMVNMVSIINKSTNLKK